MTWEGDSWKQAAREYHAARPRSKRDPEEITRAVKRDRNLVRLRRLLDDGISLTNAHWQLHQPSNRPLPKSKRRDKQEPRS